MRRHARLSSPKAARDEWTMPMTADARRDALKALVSAEGVAFTATPILLPANPYFELAGEEFGARLVLTTAPDGTELCLRPDFTLPIAVQHLASGAATPTAYGYLGPIFRQRGEGPSEFDQAGLELLAAPDPVAALDRIVDFARATLEIYEVSERSVRLGSVALFESLLAQADMPAVWRPRLRARFGHPEAMARLLDRLGDPHAAMAGPKGMPAGNIVDWVAELMLSNGLGLTGSRTPEEITARYLEKQALEEAHVPAPTVALLRDYLTIAGPADTALDQVRARARADGLDLGETLEDVAAQIGQLRASGGLNGMGFDAGFSPRLDYYTGLVFEITGALNTVLASGGQYDRLFERLGSPEPISAVGCAVWVGRLEAEAGIR